MYLCTHVSIDAHLFNRGATNGRTRATRRAVLAATHGWPRSDFYEHNSKMELTGSTLIMTSVIDPTTLALMSTQALLTLSLAPARISSSTNGGLRRASLHWPTI